MKRVARFFFQRMAKPLVESWFEILRSIHLTKCPCSVIVSWLDKIEPNQLLWIVMLIMVHYVVTHGLII